MARVHGSPRWANIPWANGEAQADWGPAAAGWVRSGVGCRVERSGVGMHPLEEASPPGTVARRDQAGLVLSGRSEIDCSV